MSLSGLGIYVLLSLATLIVYLVNITPPRASRDRVAASLILSALVVFGVGHVLSGGLLWLDLLRSRTTAAYSFARYLRWVRVVEKVHPLLGSLWSLSGVAGVCLALLAEASLTGSSGVQRSLCSRVPVEFVVVVFVSPAVLQQVLPALPFGAYVVSWCISFATLAVAIESLGSLRSNYGILVCHALFFGFMSSVQLSRRRCFLLWSAALKVSSGDKRKDGGNDESNEANVKAANRISQHILTNINHDLLTPIQALEVGLETLRFLVDETFVLPECFSAPTEEQIGGIKEPGASMADTTPLDSAKVEDGQATSAMTSIEKAPQLFSNPLGLRAQFNNLINSMTGTLSFMSMVIYRLLDASKCSCGIELTPHCEFFDYAASTRNCVDTMLEMQNSIAIEVVDKLVGKQKNSLLFTDQRWFEGSILCLLSNAVKYSRNANVPVMMYLLVEDKVIKDQTTTVFTVQVVDTGASVTEEERERFFNPSQNDRSAGGSGLGLFVLSRHVATLGGLAGSFSRTDGESGSVFWFSIPFKCMPKLSPSVVVNEDGKDRAITSRTVPSYSTLQTHASIRSYADASRKSCSGRTDGGQAPDGMQADHHKLEEGHLLRPSRADSKRRGKDSGDLFQIKRFHSHSGIMSPGAIAADSKKGFVRQMWHLEGGNDVVEFNNESFSDVSPVRRNDHQRRKLPIFDDDYRRNPEQNISPTAVTLDDRPLQRSVMVVLLAATPDEEREQIRKQLVDLGHIVETMDDGLAALQRLKEHLFDVAILSMSLDKKGLEEVVVELRQFEIVYRPNQIRQVLVAFGRSMEIPEGSLIDGYFVMPVKWDKVFQFVERKLHTRKSEQSRESRGFSTDNNSGASTARSNRNSFTKEIPGGGGAKRKLSHQRSEAHSDTEDVGRKVSDTTTTPRLTPRLSLYSTVSPENRSRTESRERILFDSDNYGIASGRPSFNRGMDIHPIEGSGKGTVSEDCGDEAVDSFHELSIAVVQSSNVRSPSKRAMTSSPFDAMAGMSLRVLVVDDSLPIQKVMKLSLVKAGNVVEVLADGLSALNRMKEQSFDVVLMDLQMPVMGGEEAVRLFRQFEREASSTRPRQLIIGMSACGDDSIIDSAVASGMDAFLAKPFNIAEMMSLVNCHLVSCFDQNQHANSPTRN